MEKDFETLIAVMKQYEGFVLLDSNLDLAWIHFGMESESNLKTFAEQVDEIKDQYECAILVLTHKNEPDKLTYELVISDDDRMGAVRLLSRKLATILEFNGDSKKAKMKELGLPDLSLVTIRQIATELKQRHNLTFAIVWIENTERDNIAIEGSGKPTELVGLLSRGTHMAIEWADKNIKFHKPDDN